jgi:MFS family permease
MSYPATEKRMCAMNNNGKLEKLLSKDYIILMLACTGTAFCNYFFFTALPLYAKQLSGSNAFSGAMLMVYSIAALVARPVAGIVSDKFGRVRLLIASALICAVACALYGLTTSMILLLVIRAFNGFAFGVHSTCGGAAAADVIPKSRMAEGIGYFGLYATVASAFAPIIALAIIGERQISEFQTLFFLAAGLCLMSMIADSCITYERKRKKGKLDATESISIKKEEPAGPLPKTFLGFEYAVFLPVAVLILMFFAMSSINTFLALFADTRHLGNIGLYFTFSAIGMLLSRILFGRMTDKRGPDIVVIPGLIGTAVCLAMIPFVHDPWFLFIIGLPMGLSQGAVGPSINSMIFLRCSPQRRGTASAAYFAAIDIGFTIGGIVFGFVADVISYSFVYWISAFLVLIALGLYIITVARKKPKTVPSV